MKTKKQIKNQRMNTMYLLITITVLFLGFGPGSVSLNANEQNEQIFKVVQEMPEYTGGENARMKFLANNIKYPELARKEAVSGKVYVGFVVEKDGSISNVKVIRGVGSGCDEESIRVIKAMPKWKPGKQKGKTVRVQFYLPIIFNLN
jgi:periplasmic protein TonB